MGSIKDLIRPTITQIPQYHPGRPTDDEVCAKGIAKLASNENPHPPAEPVLDRMRELLERVRLYPDAECERLVCELAAKTGFAPGNVIAGRGSDEVIHMLGLAFLNPGDEVIMPSPPFTLYPSTAFLMGAVPVMVPWRNYHHDLEAMAEAITDRTKLMFIANPDNPTGTIVTAEQVAAFMERVPDRVIVAFDEAYAEYVDDPKYPDTLQYIRQERPVIVLRTFSKIYALAGLRIGYGIAPAELIEYLKLVREPFNCSSLAQEAAWVSLQHPEIVQRARAVNAQGKAYLYGEFDRLGLPYVPTQSNFILVNIGVDVDEAFDALLERRVTVRVAKGGWPAGHVRVTIGTQQENERLIAALEEALPALTPV